MHARESKRSEVSERERCRVPLFLGRHMCLYFVSHPPSSLSQLVSGQFPAPPPDYNQKLPSLTQDSSFGMCGFGWLASPGFGDYDGCGFGAGGGGVVVEPVGCKSLLAGGVPRKSDELAAGDWQRGPCRRADSLGSIGELAIERELGLVLRGEGQPIDCCLEGSVDMRG